MTAAAMLVAIAIDGAIGWPNWVYSRIGHPVTWLGALISVLEKHGNRTAYSSGTRLAMGTLTVVICVGATVSMAWVVASLLPEGYAGVLLTGLLAASLVATRSLYDHVAAVATPLTKGDLEGARRAVAMIVGRDPAQLDTSAIARAALESLAENTSDGVVAPIFWGGVFGLPGIAGYKAINTLDSMIGHRSDRYLYFGRSAARLDDLVNLIPARLTGLLFCVAARNPRTAFRVMRRDARAHRSPNAGWPEAAMAGGLGIRLSGPRVYGTETSEEPWLNGTCPDPTPEDLSRGLRLYLRSMLGLGGVLAVLAMLTW
ncbi:adenosylcobinamide-phosphate synthase CbiB [Tropicimonas marinistellae]|uniref:adenosylcobinamide-phosphate synthase CbiB n=1 Tax=Tropicimonas marinistellae TaxID=1739787 RepID=UPI00082AFF49|nr:adenosylcobinamide-phosphate synthase CbiB [Tropicimonas marinistellae]